MPNVTETEVLTALRQVIDPELRRSIVELGMVRDLVIKNGSVTFTLALTIPGCPLRDQLVEETYTAVKALPGVGNVAVNLSTMSDAERSDAFRADGPPPLALAHNAIKHVIAVMSGKGGVGKSLVTALLGSYLAHAGYRVGVLDADVTGPSIPRLFGVHGSLTVGERGIEPVQSRLGIKLMSANFIVDEESQAIIWRGQLISSAIKQFWNDVHWGQLDYLLVDLPPGTSDAALTVMQSLPLDGIIMVTTPQSLAAMVVRKAVKLAQAVGVPILGIVENMAGFVAPDTGAHYEIFGPSHAEEVSAAAGAPVIARLPIDPEAAMLCDTGEVESVTKSQMDALIAHLTALVMV